MKKKSIPLLLSLTITIIFISCSPIKKLENVEKNTSQLRDDIGVLRGDFQVVKSDLNGIHTSIVSVYQAGLQAGTENARMENIEKMESSTKTMEERQNHATHYYLAFEYNFWKLNPRDNDEILEEFKRAGVEEFLTLMEGYIEKADISDFKKIDLTPKKYGHLRDIARQNLLAFAIALHKTNHIHAEIKKNIPSFKAISMKNLLEEGLRYRLKLASGEMSVDQLPIYAKAVLEHEAIATYLLQLRHNILAAYGVNRLPGFRELNEFEKFWIVATGNNKELASWDIKLENLNNSAELGKINAAFEESLKTRDYLQSIQINPVYNQALITLLSKINTGFANNLDAQASAAEMNKLTINFFNLWKKIVAIN